MRVFALGVRFWSGPAPIVGHVTGRGLVKCLDHDGDEEQGSDPIHADTSYREPIDLCETCGRHVCAAYLEANRPTYFTGNGAPAGHWTTRNRVMATEAICKYCGRVKAVTAEEYDADLDGTADLCGGGLRTVEDAEYDCMSHKAHLSEIRLMRATSLLNSARMLHLMGRPYVDRVTGEIDAFLASLK